MRLQIGYLPLCDAAPVILAQELGFARTRGWTSTSRPSRPGRPCATGWRSAISTGRTCWRPWRSRAPRPVRAALEGHGGPAAEPERQRHHPVEGPLRRHGEAGGGRAMAAAGGMRRGPSPGCRRRGGRRGGRSRSDRPPFSCHAYQVRLFAEAGGLDPAMLRTVVVPPQHGVEALFRASSRVLRRRRGTTRRCRRASGGSSPSAPICRPTHPRRSWRSRVGSPERGRPWSGPSPGRASGAPTTTGTSWCTASAAAATSTRNSARSPAPSRRPGAGERRDAGGPAPRHPAQADAPERVDWLLAQMRAAGQLADDPEPRPPHGPTTGRIPLRLTGSTHPAPRGAATGDMRSAHGTSSDLPVIAYHARLPQIRRCVAPTVPASAGGAAALRAAQPPGPRAANDNRRLSRTERLVLGDRRGCDADCRSARRPLDPSLTEPAEALPSFD